MFVGQPGFRDVREREALLRAHGAGDVHAVSQHHELE